ncbi:MAG: hypothetical protein GDA55_01845, partial [Cellvibrionales bacterium]|nr:hypothetical protein [Cellvibrionales bacterium]
MNDLFKVKAAFIVGLLATVFLFKPLVDSNSDFGFDIFHVKITVEHAYMFLTACLGLAVYLISLQFVSPKYFKTINSISDTCYLLALLTPLVFFVSWILM